ncbi:hypothetical protein ABID21_000240 [Pseudorhizobium tarimense]|uniref:Uncharacterized protein n=1 Tax=Pseudorhizobium tarimense TaxID=1079109 RepID=A0ABV2H0T7_9HYPH
MLMQQMTFLLTQLGTEVHPSVFHITVIFLASSGVARHHERQRT